jgi:hypothetical protein
MKDKKNREKIKRENMWNFGRPYKVYPIWRWPLVIPSFYVSRFLVNHGFKNPNILSISMIIIGFCGAILLFLDNFYLRILGCILILFSYFLDLMDGKTARMLKKDAHIGKFLDRNYHVPITAVALFGTGYFLFKNSSNVLFEIDFLKYGIDLKTAYLLLGFFCSWLFTMKAYLHSAYVHFSRDARIAKGKKIDPFYQTDMNKHLTDHIDNFTENKNMRRFYNNFLRLFIDATDLWFLLFFVVLFQLEKYLLPILIVIYIPLYFVNFHRKYIRLQLEEKLK